ncbi:hypothetical protein L6Q21_11525 [Sandaracinobacter sp. RS1-74]|uniref:hypothetical protein n=1 Tax=Sandaracinobacteroides sayramensis TaxID=2913411 RepID=UPI001EDC5430|nr:hypothetical protein [Sandaracinobacteroides sayramensis]MCG2841610.1 hypothetical protein [Sandaracinobacteroides sayramensis]
MATISEIHGRDALLTAAARCWSAARGIGAAPQPRLHHLLAPSDCGVLAPVLDSLMRLLEAALGRPFAAGGRSGMSGDERLLIALMNGSAKGRSCGNCPEGVARALDCAICSTRIMLGLALARG